MPNMEKNAYVRMRSDEWSLTPKIADILEGIGIIVRDYDCEQNTVANGFPDEGPCYAVVGDGDSEEERWNAALLDKWEDG